MASEDKKFHPGEVMVASAAGVGSAGTAAVATVRREFFTNMQTIPEVRAHLETYEAKLQKYSQEAIERAEAGNPIPRKEFFKGLQAIKREDHEGFCKLMEKMGYRSGELWREYGPGTLDRLGQMSPSSRGHIVMSSAVTAIIGAVGTLMFFNGLHARSSLGKLNEKLAQADGHGNPQR